MIGGGREERISRSRVKSFADIVTEKLVIFFRCFTVHTYRNKHFHFNTHTHTHIQAHPNYFSLYVASRRTGRAYSSATAAFQV